MESIKGRQDKKMKLIRSQAGFTITELMVVIVISGVLMAVAATGFSAFFSKFADLNQTIELQRDAFNCMQTIKNGIPIGSGSNLIFSGIATADSVKFLGAGNNTSSNIMLYPPTTNIAHVSDYVRIFHDGRYVRATYKNGTIQPPAPLYLFPKPTRNNKIYVTGLRFTKTNAGEASTKVITVELDARALIRKGQYKTISYKTKMAIAMK